MILYVKGDLFQSPAQTLVNTVNTVGVMGKGIAKQFKSIYPEMFRKYRDFCDAGKFDIGKLWLYRTSHKWVLNFPTKKDWRQPSRAEFIEAGLKNFQKNCSKMQIHSIAFPALGCGNGELDWKSTVQPLMEKYLKYLPVDIFIYPPMANASKPEHKEVEAVRNWLRSEPEALSFSEVWTDLREAISKQKEFRTIAQGVRFYADYIPKPEGIRVNKKLLPKDRWFNLWQQIRSHGVTTRGSAPEGLDKSISYMAPIFSALPYLRIVRISTDPQKLRVSPSYGLQYFPPVHTGADDMDLFAVQLQKE